MRDCQNHLKLKENDNMTRDEWNKKFIEFCLYKGWWDEDTCEELANEADEYFGKWPNNPQDAAKDIWFMTRG